MNSSIIGRTAVALASLTLLIGVVIAYLLGLQAEQFGANIFVVDGVGIGATREFERQHHVFQSRE